MAKKSKKKKRDTGGKDRRKVDEVMEKTKKSSEFKKEVSEKEIPATHTAEELTYMQEIIKTFLPLFLGIVAGIISFFITGDLRTRDPMSIVVLVFSIYVNKFLMPRFNINLQGKDWAGIGFLTFTTWYISWTLLLNI